MTAILKVDTIQDTAGNNIINENADTITIGASGDTIALAGTTVTGITQGITEADQFRLTADISNPSGDISSNLERVDDATFAKIGTGMTESSGIYTFPSTGLYLVTLITQTTAINDAAMVVTMQSSSNSGTSYDDIANSMSGIASGSINVTMSIGTFVNVTNASTFRVKFASSSFASGTLKGDTSKTETGFTFIRLGDSQ